MSVLQFNSVFWVKCPFGGNVFGGNVFWVKCLLGEMSFCVFLGNCLLGEMSFGGTVFWGKRIWGKCPGVITITWYLGAPSCCYANMPLLAPIWGKGKVGAKAKVQKNISPHTPHLSLWSNIILSG